jgi:hypothetical protein
MAPWLTANLNCCLTSGAYAVYGLEEARLASAEVCLDAHIVLRTPWFAALFLLAILPQGTLATSDMHRALFYLHFCHAYLIIMGPAKPPTYVSACAMYGFCKMCEIHVVTCLA